MPGGSTKSFLLLTNEEGEIIISYNKETGMYEGFIYKIYNDVNDKIYIGQTIRTIEERWRGHLINSKEDNPQMAICRAIKKHGVANFHMEKILECICKTKDELIECLNEKEIYYIEQFNSLTPNGYNLTIGGDNISINKKTKVDAYYVDGVLYKTYESMLEAYEDVKYNENSLNGASLICKCCKGELESGYGFIWRYYGEPFDKYPITRTQEEIERIYGIREICKYSLDGKYIKSYKSIADVKREFDLKSAIQICRCCSGRARTAYGFVWRYKGEPFEKYDVKNDNEKIIDQYSLDGIYIASFKSITDATKTIEDSSHSSISLCCSGKLKQHKGYVWRYHGDSFDKFSLSNGNSKKVNQYTMDGVYINTFESITLASKEIGTPSATMIGRYCNYLSKPRKGYMWYYAYDPNQPDKTKIIN